MPTLSPFLVVLAVAIGVAACQRSGTPPAPLRVPAAAARALAPSPIATTPVPLEMPPTSSPIYRVGGDVLEPIEISRVQPQYPEVCRAHPAQGMPILEAVIDARGTVTSVRILRPPQAPPLCPELEAACAKALSQWRYRPATLHGEPVAVHLTVTFSVHPR